MDDTSLQQTVERYLIRDLAGEARSERTSAEVATLIEAFLHCFAADCERGELIWVNELHAMVRETGPRESWTLDVPPASASGDAATVLLRIPTAALEAACLRPGDQVIVEPRLQGLWISRASRLSGN
jgi:hypothetical protein